MSELDKLFEHMDQKDAQIAALRVASAENARIVRSMYERGVRIVANNGDTGWLREGKKHERKWMRSSSVLPQVVNGHEAGLQFYLKVQTIEKKPELSSIKPTVLGMKTYQMLGSTYLRLVATDETPLYSMFEGGDYNPSEGALMMAMRRCDGGYISIHERRIVEGMEYVEQQIHQAEKTNLFGTEERPRQ